VRKLKLKVQSASLEEAAERVDRTLKTFTTALIAILGALLLVAVMVATHAH
jgi:hypothetical protein